MGHHAKFDRSGLARRVAEAVDLAGGPAKILRKTGVSSSTYNRIIKGESEASAEKLGKIAEATGASLDWLILGRGAPKFGTERPPSPASDGPDMAMIPYLSVLAQAGNGISPEHVAEVEKIPFSRQLLRKLGVRGDRIEFIRAVGDSMEPTIQDGALVLVDRSKNEIVGDAIYVVSLDNEVRIKRVHKNIDGTITLISDNREVYEPERLTRPDAERLQVHGRVCWTEKKL
jgi:phage repressor protein C with HTH and peptisase S24 domain